jgi:hypothetical protein
MRSLRLTVILLSGQAAAAAAFAAPSAQYTIFDVTGAGTQSGQGTTPYSLNASSASTGYYVDSNFYSHGFVRAADGTITTFDADGPTSYTQATAINREGAIVGYYLNPKTQMTSKGFLREAGGAIRKFSAGGASTGVQGLNDHGDAVGIFAAKDHHITAYLRAPDGRITEIRDPKAGKESGEGTYAFAINNGGVIAGQYVGKGAHGYVRSPDGTFTNFDAPGAGGFLGTDPDAINQGGWVAGFYTDSNDVFHSFIRNPDGTITTFDAPGAGTAAYQGTSASWISRDGAVVGSYVDANNVNHGFLRLKDGAIKEFDAPGAGSGSGQGTIPTSINDSNVVVGYEVDSSGVYHGFLRTP